MKSFSLAARVCGGALALVSLSTASLVGPAAAATTDCPCSLWSATDVPAVVNYTDANAVELGVRFTSDIAAPVTALRYYKSATDTGPHIGSLWSETGTLLARAEFVNETVTGWQQVSLATPVDLTPGTTYIASYHTTTGNYSTDIGYFEAGGRDNGVLHAPGGDEANGVFLYGPQPAFPTQTYLHNNYWVDVVVGRPAPTLTALAITGAPASVAKGVSRQLVATGTYSDGSSAAVTTGITWASSNPAAATVSATGVLQAAGVGSATITASVGDVTTSVAVTVTPAVMTALTVTPGTTTLRLLGFQQLKATATYTDGTTVDVSQRAKWTTSSAFIALTGNGILAGKVVGLLPGIAVVTASVDGHTATATITVRW